LLCDTYIDPHFISYIEYKNPKKCRFVRIDADIDNALKSDNSVDETDEKALIEVFKENLVNQDLQIKVEQFKTGKIPAIINVDEFMRRMSEMGGFYGMNETDATKNATLVLNATNPIILSVLKAPKEKQKLIVNQIYYLAMLSFKKLSAEELNDLTEKSCQLLFDYSK
jgi:HSP90 family molecular chaperone